MAEHNHSFSKANVHVTPSPYVNNFIRSSFKYGSLNDSLDKMKGEFMMGYNEAMQESENMKMSAAKGLTKGGSSNGRPGAGVGGGAMQ